jgi:hypothetical protein
MLDIALNLEDGQVLDIDLMKKNVTQRALEVKQDEDFDKVKKLLLQESLVEMKK